MNRKNSISARQSNEVKSLNHYSSTKRLKLSKPNVRPTATIQNKKNEQENHYVQVPTQYQIKNQIRTESIDQIQVAN
eukprot:Pgem_evm1s11492